MGVITKLDYIKGSFLCILGSFLKVKVQNGGIFGVAKYSNIFGVMEIPDIFFFGGGGGGGVNSRCLARAYV